MYNLNIYYKYIIHPQFLLKFSEEQKYLKISKYFLKKICISTYMTDVKDTYYIYLYNICILIRLIINKKMYIKKRQKKFNVNNIHWRVSLKDVHMYLFLDIFSTLLLPLFENFNMYLNIKNFDTFGNFVYEFNYCDPIFMSKNAVLVWSPKNKIKILFHFNNREIEKNIAFFQYCTLNYFNI